MLKRKIKNRRIEEEKKEEEKKEEDEEDEEDEEEEKKKEEKRRKKSKRKNDNNIIKKEETYLYINDINIKRDSPYIKNAIDFFMLLENDDMVFYDNIFDYEKKKYIKEKKNISLDEEIKNYKLNKDDLTVIYRTMAFKMDTIHDFTGSRSKEYIKDLVYPSIGWDNIIKYKSKDTKDTKLKLPSNLEDNFLYWILRHNVILEEIFSKSVKLYITASIENFVNTLKDDEDLLYTMDAADSEKRIGNFKNLLAYEKFLKNNKNMNETCKRVNSIKNISQKYNLPINDVNNIIDNIKEENENDMDVTENNKKSIFKIIFPQLFDANASTGKIVKSHGTILTQEIDNELNEINFDVIEDKISMIYNSNDIKINIKSPSHYEYKIKNIIVYLNNSNYNKIIADITFDRLKKFKYTLNDETLHCDNIGPGVSQMINIYEGIRDYLNKDSEQSSEILDLFKNISVIKRIGDYSQIWYCKSVNKNYTYISNDRMSSSFSYIENVNFIGQFKDSGIFINFNDKLNETIKKNISEKVRKDKNILGDEINFKNILKNKLNLKFPNFISYTFVPDVTNYVKYLFELYKESFDFYENLFDYEKEKYIKTYKLPNLTYLTYENYKNILLIIAFKLDSIHDFKDSRANPKIKNSSKIKNQYENEDNDEEIEDEEIEQKKILSKDDVIKSLEWDTIYKNIKTPLKLENNFFYWVVNKLENLRTIFQKDKINVTYTTSIENYINCIKNKKTFITIDASESRIRNLKNYLLYFNVITDKNLVTSIKNIENYKNIDYQISNDIISKYNQTKEYIDIINTKDINIYTIENINNEDNKDIKENIDKVINYFIYLYTVYNDYITYKQKIDIFKLLLIYIFISNNKKLIENKIKQISDLKKKILDIYNISGKNKISCKEEIKIEEKDNKFFSDLKNNCDAIKKIFDYEQIFCNDKKKLYICDIFKEILYNNEIISNITNAEINKYMKYLEFKKLLILTFENTLNEINETYNFNVEENIKQTFIDNFIENDGILSLKVISPQLFDANATTGNKITAKNLDIYSKLDNKGYYCNMNNIDDNENFDLILNDQQIEKCYKFIFDNKSRLILLIDKINEKKINDIEDYNILIEFKDNLKKIKDILEEKIISLKKIKDNSKDKKINNDTIRDLIEKKELKINDIYVTIYVILEQFDLLTKNTNINNEIIDRNILNILDNINMFLSAIDYKKNNCCMDIINNIVCIKQDKDYVYNYKSQGKYIFNVLTITINNKDNNINEFYKINNICLLNLTNREQILKYNAYSKKSSDIKIDLKKYNQHIDLIYQQYYLFELMKNKNFEVPLSQPITKKITKEQEELLLENQIIIENFVYIKATKTLYCLNTGPGVAELVKIYDALKEKDDKNNINKYILENILTIKRIGDYSQIDYCKKNNYIYVSNDIMSSSFSYIIGSKFIGSLSNFGIFIKDDDEYISCISNKNRFDIKC